jgi:hypothetical protein
MNMNQRITENENREAWLIFSDRKKFLALSDEQSAMVEAYITAGQIKKDTGEWPTLQQVEDRWMQEADERARKRDALIAETARTRNANQAAA